MSNGITIEEAVQHRAVEKHVRDGTTEYLVVRPYGNSILFKNLVMSSKVRLQNTAIEDGGDRLRVHVSSRG